MRGDELVGDCARALVVQVGDDDVGAACGERPGGGPADPARAAGDERDASGQLAGRRRLRELVALERPVLDRERLGLVERAEAAECVGRAFDGDRPVVEVARDARAARVGTARDDADAGHEDDARARRVDRELPGLVVDVALVVRAVPAAYSLDAAPERSRSCAAPWLRIELDDERPVLRVDQVVGARRADLAHLGRAQRGGERDRLGAAVDLEHEAGGIVEKGAAERGEGPASRDPASSSPSSAAFVPPSPKRPAAAPSIAARRGSRIRSCLGSSPRSSRPR